MQNPFPILVLTIIGALPITVVPAVGQEMGDRRTENASSCEGNVWVFNGVELGFLDRGKLALMLGDRVLPSGCYWYDKASGMFGIEGQPPAGDLPPGVDLGGPLRADASHGASGVFLNGREVTTTELQNLKKFGVALGAGRYWINSQGVGGREGSSAEFQLSASAAAPAHRPPASPGRSRAGAGSNDQLYQSGDTYGGVQGNCVFMSGPGFSYMGEGC